MRIVLFAVGAFLIGATLLPLVRGDAWWIRVFDFPRLQIAVLLALLIVGFFFVRHSGAWVDRVFLAVLVLGLGYQLYGVFPYTPLATPQVVRAKSCDPANSIRMLVANVLMTNRRADDFLALVREQAPDVVLVLETDEWWDRQLGSLDGDYPHSVKHPRENTYGMHLFSKLQLSAPEIRFRIEADVPSLVTGITLRSGQQIDFYGVHPKPPRPAQDTDQRDAEILLVGKDVHAGSRPAIVAGDLNDVAWSHSTRLFQRISGTLDPRIGRGMFPTFHAGYPGLRWPLDHVFHTEHFMLREIRRLSYFGSDHFPVLVELCHTPEAPPRQQAPSADSGDREEAQEKIQEGKESGD